MDGVEFTTSVSHVLGNEIYEEFRRETRDTNCKNRELE